MNSTKLGERLREILKPAGAPGPKGPGLRPSEKRSPSEPGLRESDVGRVLRTREEVHGRDPSALERILGGEWRQSGSGRCFVIERRVGPSIAHGRHPVGALTPALDGGEREAALMTGTPACAPILFFDLETTGLSGGAGTHAFLVGCGWFDDEGGFATRQYLLTRFAEERPLLETVAAELTRAGTLVTFNGKSFDAPVLETRYLFHRLGWMAAQLPHLDVIHPARRFWRGSDCSLIALERQVLGVRRASDVAGFEIPERYFQFVRTGDARRLAPVVEHNRLDLLSLAGLTARLLQLVRRGPDEARNACEALALGRVYARAGLESRARVAFERAVELSADGDRGAESIEAIKNDSIEATRINALRALATTLRRAREYNEAAACWRRLLDDRDCSPRVAREATEALAIHHEHRVRDLAAAKAFALRTLQHGPRPSWDVAVRHRLARIERKLERMKSEVLSLKFQ